MQPVGQTATNCVYTTFCSLSYATVSLSWLPSGVPVMHARSTGAQLAATVQMVCECGESMAIKYEVNCQVVHQPRLLLAGCSWQYVVLLNALGYFLVVISWWCLDVCWWFLVVSSCLLVICSGVWRFVGNCWRWTVHAQFYSMC